MKNSSKNSLQVEKINEFLRTIEERLKTLEEEKEELKEYQRWDRSRRVLEFIIHETEMQDNKRKLEEVCSQIICFMYLKFLQSLMLILCSWNDNVLGVINNDSPKDYVKRKMEYVIQVDVLKMLAKKQLLLENSVIYFRWNISNYSEKKLNLISPLKI